MSENHEYFSLAYSTFPITALLLTPALYSAEMIGDIMEPGNSLSIRIHLTHKAHSCEAKLFNRRIEKSSRFYSKVSQNFKADSCLDNIDTLDHVFNMLV